MKSAKYFKGDIDIAIDQLYKNQTQVLFNYSYSCMVIDKELKTS